MATHSILVEAGDHATKISTRAGDRWTIEATWVSERVTEWAVNKIGKTYSELNEFGQPDIISIVAANNEPGFVYATKLAQANGGAHATKSSSFEDAFAWQEKGNGKSLSVTIYTSDA